MLQEPTAEELLALVVKNDEEALGELYDRFAPGLLGMLLRILHDRDAAHEVLQDVFLRLWNEARRYGQHGASVAAWLVVMARTAAIERLRGERKLSAVDRGIPAPLLKSFSWLPRPEEIALLDERHELLNKVINQLPMAQRKALELAVFEGYTQAEIARQRGEPLGRVKAELRAGMTFLRHRLRAVLGTWAANI